MDKYLEISKKILLGSLLLTFIAIQMMLIYTLYMYLVLLTKLYENAICSLS